jgi:DNA-binding transcriptional regulator YdaS (Cro superfamily)
MSDRLLNSAETAVRLGVKRTTLDQWRYLDPWAQIRQGGAATRVPGIRH